MKPPAATTAFPTGTLIEAAAGILAAISIATSAMTTAKAPKTLVFTAKLFAPLYNNHKKGSLSI